MANFAVNAAADSLSNAKPKMDIKDVSFFYNDSKALKNITLPLLLVAVGPLLIASFTFNFNNFNLIYLFNAGGPPMAGTPTPAGHTDILISYVYNLAFSGSRGVNYGFAAAITIIIFFIVGSITLFQFRLTRSWEAVSENV